MIASRHTIARDISLHGVGLHLGHQCRLTFRPAAAGSGIRFRRSDLPGTPITAARASEAVLTERRTQLGTGPGALHTVEHVLAALAGMEIDDLLIDMSAPEPPILDGSAEPFRQAIEAAGVLELAGVPDVLSLAEPLRVTDGDSWYEARPSEDLTLDVTIEFPHPAVGRQSGRYVLSPAVFARELAAARTFGFVHEVDALRARGLIRGASTENAVVLGDEGVIGTTLRWPDEFVRHKALDCVGDLALAGARVRAAITAFRPSHRGTVLLVREMTEVHTRRRECTV